MFLFVTESNTIGVESVSIGADKMEVEGATASKLLKKQFGHKDFTEKFDVLAENLFHRYNKQISSDESVYDVSQYPIEEHQHRRMLESQMSTQ